MSVSDGVERVWVGTLADLRATGHLVAKVGAHGVLVIWQDGRAHAIDDRCPQWASRSTGARSRRGW